MGYRFQFIALAGFNALNAAMFESAVRYQRVALGLHGEFPFLEFDVATRHQREVGAGYFDEVAKIVSGGRASTLALEGSTEAAQFDGTVGAQASAI